MLVRKRAIGGSGSLVNVMCGRGACSLGLRDEGGRAVASRAADGVEAFGIVIGPSFGHVWTHGWFDGWWASQLPLSRHGRIPLRFVFNAML